MAKSPRPLVGSLILVGLMVFGAVIFAQRGKDSVTFCQRVLKELIAGRSAVSANIDWNHLQAVGVNVGAQYTALPNDQERAKYRQTFVSGFAHGFAQAKGNIKDFTHWQIEGQNAHQITVAANYDLKHKVLLMTIPASGKKMLESLQWQ